jgi:hypothetical protein
MITRGAGVMWVAPQGSGGTRALPLGGQVLPTRASLQLLLNCNLRALSMGESAINRTYHVRPGAGELSEKSSCSRKIDDKSARGLEILGPFRELTFKNSGATPRPSVSMAMRLPPCSA